MIINLPKLKRQTIGLDWTSVRLEPATGRVPHDLQTEFGFEDVIMSVFCHLYLLAH